jgi:hypothetical protein
MFTKPRGSGIWFFLAIVAWVAVFIGGPLRLLVFAGGFVFFGSLIPIAILRALEDGARRVDWPGLSAILVILCNLGKAAVIAVLIYIVLAIFHAYGIA